MDKKSDLLSQGPKSHHPQVTQSPNQQQTPSTQTIVNSTNNNSSVSNNNRKSSETVTSSEEELELTKAEDDQLEDGKDSTVAAQAILASALGEDEDDEPEAADTPSVESELVADESQKPAASDTAPVDTTSAEREAEAPESSEAKVEEAAKGEDPQDEVKKVGRA